MKPAYVFPHHDLKTLFFAAVLLSALNLSKCFIRMVVLFSQGGGGSVISRPIIGSYILEHFLVFIGTWKKVCIVSPWSCFVTLMAWLKLAPAVLISAM